VRIIDLLYPVADPGFWKGRVDLGAWEQSFSGFRNEALVGVVAKSSP